VFEQEYRERINQVIKAIIRNPDGEWNTQSMARLAGISPFHFHRIFRALTGETMFAFLQRRKLLRAVELINEGRFSLTEIALECGFDSGSSLSRAFRKHFNCTPSEYRTAQNPLLLPPPRPRATRNSDRQAQIRKISSRDAVIVERRGLIDQNFNRAAREAFRALTLQLNRVDAWSLIRERIGMCPDEAGMAPDAEARYQAGFFFEGEIPAMGTEVQQVTIPGGRWVVSMHRGSYETLWQSWNQLYRDWLPTSGFHPRDAIPFEVYCSNPKHTPAEKLLTEIWIPIL